MLKVLPRRKEFVVEDLVAEVERLRAALTKIVRGEEEAPVGMSNPAAIARQALEGSTMSDADIVKRGLTDPHYHQEALAALARMEEEVTSLRQQFVYDGVECDRLKDQLARLEQRLYDLEQEAIHDGDEDYR